MSQYRETYERWKANPEAFWAKAAQDIDWMAPWQRTFETSGGLDRWFAGALCNTCFNCLDRHVTSGRNARTSTNLSVHLARAHIQRA